MTWATLIYCEASLVAQMVKTLPTKQETQVQSLGCYGRSPREGNGNPFQYSCLENSMDRGAWWATFHGVAKSPTRLKCFSMMQVKKRQLELDMEQQACS